MALTDKDIDLNVIIEGKKRPIYFLKGQIMNVKNLPTDNVTRYLIKAFFYQFAPVAYVTYETHSYEANIRFRSAEKNAAFKALERIDQVVRDKGGKIVFLGKEVECKVLEDEEEQRYWIDFKNDQARKQMCAPKTKQQQKKSQNNGHLQKNDDNFEAKTELRKKSGSYDIANVHISLLLQSCSFVMGHNSTLRSIRNGRAKLVVIANNAPTSRKQQIEYSALLAKTDVYNYDGTDIEIGALCKRDFGVSFLCLMEHDDAAPSFFCPRKEGFSKKEVASRKLRIMQYIIIICEDKQKREETPKNPLIWPKSLTLICMCHVDRSFKNHLIKTTNETEAKCSSKN